MSDLTALPVPVLVGLGVLVLVEFGLMVWGVLDWVKRPAEQVRGNRLVWLLVIVLVNIVGPVLYLTVGRRPRPAEDAMVSTAEGATSAAADALYGSRDDSVVS